MLGRKTNREGAKILFLGFKNNFERSCQYLLLRVRNNNLRERGILRKEGFQIISGNRGMAILPPLREFFTAVRQIYSLRVHGTMWEK